MAGFEARQSPQAAPARIYLRKRQLKAPEKAYEQTVAAISEWEAVKIKTALGALFNIKGRVVVRRPWWMPVSFYMWLLRSIVVERQITERGAVNKPNQ